MAKKKEFTFVPARGSALTQQDAATFGPKLLQLAEDLQINGLRHLDKRRLYEHVEKLPEDDPLRQWIFREDDEEAAREHRIDLCGKLIRSIRIIPLNVKIPVPVPIFVHTRAPVVADGSIRTQRTQVMREDLGKFDAVLMGAGSSYIKRMRDAFGQFEHLVGDFDNVPVSMRSLSKALRAAFDAYDAEIHRSDKAAE